MFPRDVRDWLDARPFRPFRLFLSDRANYLVSHPELVSVGRSTLVVAMTGTAPDPSGFLRTATVSLVHVVRIEPENPEPPAQQAEHS